MADLMMSHESGLDQDTEKPDITITSGFRQSYIRFDTLSELWQSADGVMTSVDVRDALAAAAQSNSPGENGGELTC